MRRLSLSTLLIGFNVGSVLLAILIVGLAGGSLLRRLADEQARARVELAGLGAVQAIDRTAERLETSARLLAERPTLARLLLGGDAGTLGEFLVRFGETSQLSACALLRDGQLFATGGVAFPWRDVARESAPAGVRILAPGDGREQLVMVAWAAVPSVPNARAVAARLLDSEYARQTAEKVSLPVEILSPEASGEVATSRRALRTQALNGSEVVTGLSDEEGAYFTDVPLRDPAGQVVGLVEAALGADVVEHSLRRLGSTLILLSLIVAALAIVFGLTLARRIAAPVEALTTAAVRIGRGDLASAVPRTSGREIGTLATAMEEMRERILGLTTELRRRRAEAEAILSGIVEGVFAVDRERRIRYLNPQAARLLGIRAADARGRFCGDVLNPQGPHGVRPCEERCPILHARFRGSAGAMEQLLLASGERKSVVITSAPPHGDAEEPGGETHQFQVLRDETEVEVTRRVRDAVLANISHEFRTPLSAQLASLELLRDRLPELEPQEVRELVLSIERGTLRLTRLIDNLLESTRIEAGQDSLRQQAVVLDEIVEEEVELVAPLIEQRQQILEVDLPYPLPGIRADGPRLVQVLVNLLANANKFAPPGTKICLGVEVRDREVALFVSDEGPGMPDGATDAVFERFTRSVGDEPEAGGMGLGLFIVKSIIARHGGRVEVDSHETGTRVWAILPREQDGPTRSE